MTTNRTLELLYDSEAALRLLDHELDELRHFTDGEPAPAEAVAPTATMPPAEEPAPFVVPDLLPRVLERVTAEIRGVASDLGDCRAALDAPARAARVPARLEELEARLDAIARLVDPRPRG